MPIAYISAGTQLANTGLAIANAGSDLGPGGNTGKGYNVVQLTPEEQKFFELQTLQAEKDSAAQTASVSNAADNQASANNAVKFVIFGLLGWVGFKILKKQNWI